MTAKQKAVLAFIQSFTRKHGYQPSYREIGDHFGWSVNGAVFHIRKLEEAGAILPAQGRSRGFEIVKLEKWGKWEMEYRGKIS
jgi:repressor LexA